MKENRNNALVTWVVKHKFLVEDLIYVDDSFGVEDEGEVLWYAPYACELPKQQAKLLMLWDELGIPHKQEKQIHGKKFMVLGIDVDVEELSFMLTEEAHVHLMNELEEWSQRGVRKRVKEWRRVARWINWALDVHPLLRPALNNVYAKLKEKDQDTKVWANVAMREDLDWAREKVAETDGVLLLKSLSWETSACTCTLETDVCPDGYTYWYPSTK